MIIFQVHVFRGVPIIKVSVHVLKPNYWIAHKEFFFIHLAIVFETDEYFTAISVNKAFAWAVLAFRVVFLGV